MRRFNLWFALLAGGTAATGALVSVLLGDGSRSRFDDLAIATVILTCAVVGVVLQVARPENRVATVMLAGAVAWGVGEGLLAWGVDALARTPGSATYVLLAVIGTAARGVGWLLLVLVLPVIFPDGRAESRLAARLATGCIIAFAAGSLLAPVPLEERLTESENPIGVPETWSVLVDLLAVGSLALAGLGIALAIRSLVHRWRAGDDLRRQQVLVFGIAFALPLALLPLMPTPWVEPWMFALVTLPIPVAVAVAVLQRRLYDIPLALNKTLTYVLALSRPGRALRRGRGRGRHHAARPRSDLAAAGGRRRRGRGLRSAARLPPTRREPPDLWAMVRAGRGARRDRPTAG